MSVEAAGHPAEGQGVQPESDRVWSIETHGIDPIPESDRHGKPSDLFPVWFAANVSILGISYGTYLVTFYGLSLWQAVVAGALGTIVSFLLVGFISLAGKKGSAPTLVLSRASFGVRGNVVPTLVSWIALVGWEIVLVALATLAVETIIDRLGWGTGDVVLAIAFVVIAAITIAIGLLGHATIVRIQTWFTWAFAVLTIVFFLLELGEIDWAKVTSLPSGSFLGGFLGGMAIIMAGLGIGWVNAAADYSRYLPRTADSRAVVWWTTLGASAAPVILIAFGVLLAANNDKLASSANPIGDLAAPLPTWFLVPYLITAVGGLLAGAVLDIYSSGLNLLTLGVRIPRYQSVAFDGVLMVIGNIYILFIAKNFIGPFIAFLISLGILLASWSAIFLVDLWLNRRTGYAERDLYDARARYGAVNWAAIVAFALAVFVGWGLVGPGLIFDPPAALTWLGYLLPLVGGETGAIGGGGLAIPIAFAVGGLAYGLLSPALSPHGTRDAR
jgi:nucleobase:cation symporter-1, NCS1 family